MANRVDPIESQFLGKWRITKMPDFDAQTIDMLDQAAIEFDKSQTGCRKT